MNELGTARVPMIRLFLHHMCTSHFHRPLIKPRTPRSTRFVEACVAKREMFAFVTLCKEDNDVFFKAMYDQKLKVNVVEVRLISACAIATPVYCFLSS